MKERTVYRSIWRRSKKFSNIHSFDESVSCVRFKRLKTCSASICFGVMWVRKTLCRFLAYVTQRAKNLCDL